MNAFTHDNSRGVKILPQPQSLQRSPEAAWKPVKGLYPTMLGRAWWCLMLTCLLPGLGWSFSLNSRVLCNDSGVNVRNSAGGTIVGQQSLNVQGTVIGGPTNASVGTTSYTWYNVNFDSGQDGWVASTYLSAASLPRPTTSSVSPSSVVGSSTPRTFTVNGSNFVSGSLVQVAYSSNGYSFVNTNTAATFVSSSRLTVPITTTTEPDTWRVRVRNPDGQTSSGYETFTVTAPQSLPGSLTLSNEPPVWDTTSPAGPAVRLNWSASTGATSYEVFRNGSKIYPTSGTFTGQTFYNSAGLVSGQSYTYQIIARNAAGTTGSNSISVGPMPNAPPSLPATPGYLEAQVFAYRVELGWTDQSTNEQGFKIERRVGSAAWSQVATVGAVSGGDVFWTDTTTQPKTTYSYRVRAYNSLGNSGYTNESGGTTPAGKPGSFTLNHDAAVWDTTLPGPKVRLTWTPASDAGGYSLYRDGSLYTAGIAGTSFINQSGLNAGQTYTYRIRASNSEGTTDSNTITVTMPQAPPTVPTAPDLLLASVVSGGIQLSWADRSSNEQGFKIERRPATAAGWVALATLGANVTSYLDSQTEYSTAYVYRVRAYNSVGPSTYSAEATATSNPPGAPGTFTLRHDAPYWDSRAPAGPAVMLRWDVAAGAASYAVYRDGSKIHPKSGEPAYTGRTYQNNLQLAPGGTHTFYIVAQNAGGSTQSNAVTIVMPAAPSGTPQIDKLTPTTVAGVPLPDRVTLNLQGSGFQAGVKAYVSYSGAANQLLDASHVQRLDAENVTVRVATSVDADTWSIYLKNPDNKTSNTKTFQVTAPTGTVSLYQISPPVISPSAQARVFTLTGSGFGATDRVKLTTTAGSVYVSAPDVQFIGHQTLKFSRSFTQSPQTVTVRVVKANAAESDPVTLTVNQTLMPNLRVDPASIQVAQASVPVGGALDVSYTVQNIGTGPAPVTTTRFRLSTDRRLTSTDPGFENLDWSIDAIPAQQSLTPPSVRLFIPQTLPPGQYYVGLFVDAFGEARQSDETDDGALDLQAITVTATAAPEAPRFTLHPKSQNPTAGSGFSLEAQASGALRYVWYFNGQPIQDPLRSPVGKKEILHINFPTAGNAGEYWVEAIGVNGLTALSNKAVIRFISSTPPDADLRKGRFKLNSLDNAHIRPDWPTVVLTHGWQINFTWDNYDERSTPEFRSLAAKIRSNLPESKPANILLFAWQGAHRATPGEAADSVIYAGTALAKELENYFGNQYNSEMHFIGHSLGCFVSAVAIQKISDWNIFPNMPTAEGQRKVHLTVLDPAFNSPVSVPFTADKFAAPGVGWSDCLFQETLKNDRLIAVVENYYANVGWGAGGPISNAGPRFRGTLLTKDELGTNENAHSAVWNTWYRGTIGNGSYELDKGGFNNSILLQDHRSQIGWNWLYDRYPWSAERSCIHEPSDLQTMKVGIIDAADVVGDLTKDGLNLVVDKLSGAVQEGQDQLHGILTKTKDLITLPFQQQVQQRQFAAKSMDSAATTSAAPEGLSLKSVLTIPAQAERIRILAKRTDTATDGVLAVLFAGVPLQVLGTDYFSDTEFRELTLPIRHLRNRTGELELVLKRENGEEISLRIGIIEIENQSDVVAASSSLVVTKPAKNLRTLSSRTLCQGQWKGKVPLQALTLRVNQGAAIPLTVEADGTWRFEADGLLSGNNQLSFDATTIHGQTLSASREVWRIVPANFQLAVQGEGQVKGVKIGTSTLEVGQELKLSTTPKVGHIFERWSGAHSGTSRALNLRVAAGMSLTAHFIPSPFVGREGSYAAAITADDPAHTGWLQIKLTSQGSFTGTWFIGSTAVPVKGLLDSQGRITLWHSATATELRLQLDLQAAMPTLSAQISHGAEIIASAQAQRPAYDGKQRIAPQSGNYTLALEPVISAALPQGYGYGTVSISKAGAVRLTARLPDKTAITMSPMLDAAGTWPVHAALYAKKGWLSGSVLHGDGTNTPEISGTLAWVKPATVGSYLPAAWSTTLTLIGSRFEKPAAGQRLIGELNNSGDNLSLSWQPDAEAQPQFIVGHLDAAHRFKAGAPGSTLTLNATSGLFTGTTLQPETQQKLSLAGVLLQRQRLGLGQVQQVETTSALRLQPFESTGGQVAVQVQVLPAGSATVTGAGNYSVGQAVQLVATPAEGYSFMNWLENQAEVGTQAQLNFVVSASRTLTAQMSASPVNSLSDTFARADASSVGNGWLNVTAKVGLGWNLDGNINGTFSLVSGRAQNSQTTGMAAIHRTFDHSRGLRIKATFSHVNGGGGLQKRFLHCLGVLSDGQVGNGLALQFYRADQNYNNSTVILLDGDTIVSQQSTSFQFGEWIRADATFRLDGSVQVHVANADGSSGEQTLNFPARTVNAVGSNVIFVLTGSAGSLKAWVDDLEVLQLP